MPQIIIKHGSYDIPFNIYYLALNYSDYGINLIMARKPISDQMLLEPNIL